LKRDQLNTLISILEQRGGIDLYSQNVVIKTTGGLQLKEQSVNLAIIMSIVSSVKNMPVPNNTAFLADVGLTGELKKVPLLEARVRELESMGFNTVYIAKNALKDLLKFKSIKIVELNTLSDVISNMNSFYIPVKEKDK
jgi:DNA repair protein RadA/Sms